MKHFKYVVLSAVLASVALATVSCGNDTAPSATGAPPTSGTTASNGGSTATSTTRSSNTTSSESNGGDESGGGATSDSATKANSTSLGGTASKSSSSTKSSTGKGGTSTKSSTSEGEGGTNSESSGGQGDGGNNSESSGGQGDGGTSQGEGGTSGTSETTSAGGTTGARSTEAADEMACEHLPLPNDKTDFLDFSIFRDDKTWGTDSGDAAGLTGGTSLYNGTGDTISLDGSSGKLVGTIQLAPGGYAGITFWFGPCLDVSAYTGVSFSVAVAGSVPVDMKSTFKVQTNADYPIDEENKKGACAFTSEAEKWNECLSPSIDFSMLTTEEVVKIPFADLTGGKPVDGVGGGSDLVGIQYQFECTSELACEFELTLDNITFYN